MSDVQAPLLTRRRLEDESGTSSHNLVDRHGTEEEEYEPTEYGSGVYRYPAYLQPGHFTSLEKLMFFSSSILLILLFIFAGLYARSSQQDNHPPSLPTTPPDLPKNHTKKQATCLEPSCIITAAHILQDVDQELDPCEDFYSYTCDKWMSNHLIPDVKSRIDRLTGMSETIRRRLDQILSRDYHAMEHDTSSLLLPDPNTVLDRQLFGKIQDFYRSCMNQDEIEKKSIQPLYPIFRHIRKLIPIEGNVNQDGLNEAIQYLGDLNIWPLFELVVTPDMIKNPTLPTLSLGQGQVGLPDLESYDNPDLMKVYMQAVTDILGYIFKLDDQNEFGWKSWSTIATARRIVEFEKKIVQALAEQQDHAPERWKFEELETKVPQIYWHGFIEHLTSVPTHVLIPHATFIEHLSDEVLSTTNPRTLQMYFIWRTIWKYLNGLNEALLEPKRRLDAKLIGIEARAKPERWETCIELIDASSMGVLLGRYFVKDQDEAILESKKQVESLSKSVLEIIRDRIPSLGWVHTEATRKEIMNKLNSIEFQIGFSTSSNPNIQSVISLSEYFRQVSMDPNDFFGNLVRSNQHQVKQQVWNVLEQSSRLDKEAWKLNAQSVQVVYHKELNKVMIPGGLLQLPFIDSITPAYFYYGTMGWLIGHEIMHGFDSIGRKYDGRGLFGQWWDDRTQENLDSENECLVRHYNEFEGVDGHATLNNNFADGVGLSVVESLLKQDDQEVKRIPGLNAWTKDQLGYIQFARMKCSKSTKEHKLLVKDYAPDRYRVNGPLMNSNHFAKTFECKLGSKMNPEIKKCQLW
ncbi:hypothetical protein BD770DRAFT_409694 [Pilaira anomala]|nr:hypothetical protein BD770DRAFT_409694 [Pilaira anomala]